MTSRAPRKQWTTIALCLLCLLLAAGLRAAAQDQPSTSSSPQNESKPDVPPEAPVRPNTDSYAVSLGTGQVISLSGDQQGPGNAASGETPVSLAEYADGLRVKTAGNPFRKQFFYGSSVSGFHSNGYGGVANTDVTSTTINPYLGLLVPTKTGSYIVQYAAVIDPYNPNGVEAYHTMTMNAQGAFTRRLYWSIAGGGSYGAEDARAQGYLSYLVVGGVPAVNTSSAAALFPAKNVAFGNSDISLTWLMSQREKIIFTGFYTYSAVQGNHVTPGDVGTHDNAIGSVLAYSRALSERITMRAYGEASSILNLPSCNTVGGGAGIAIKFNHDVVFDAQGGPERNSASCGGQQNANFSGSLTANLKRGNSVYITGNRVFTTAYRTTGTWEDNAGVGFAKSMKAVNAIAEAGWLRSPGLSAVTPAFQGYFFAPRVTYKITNSLGFSAGYRIFHSQGGGLPNGDLHFVTVSIDWHPAAVRF
jgi:hypothetical protein